MTVLNSLNPWANWHFSPYLQDPFSWNGLHISVLYRLVLTLALALVDPMESLEVLEEDEAEEEDWSSWLSNKKVFWLEVEWLLLNFCWCSGLCNRSDWGGMSLDPERKWAASCCFSLYESCCCKCFSWSYWLCENWVDEKAADLSFCNCSISLSSTFEAVRLLVAHGSLFLLRVEEGTAESKRDVRSDGEMVSRLLSPSISWLLLRSPIIPLWLFLSPWLSMLSKELSFCPAFNRPLSKDKSKMLLSVRKFSSCA